MKLLSLSTTGLAILAAAFGCSSGGPATAMPGPDVAPPPAASNGGAPETSPATDTATPHDGSGSGSDASASDAGLASDGGADADGGIPDADAASGTTHIAWTPGTALLAGSGCMGGAGAVVLPEPGGVRIVLPDMKVDLTSGASLSERKACAVRVPVDIPTGYYVSKIDHRLGYSLSRSAGATAALSTAIALFGTPSNPFTVAHASPTAEVLPAASALRSDTYASSSPEALAMCGARPSAGLLAVNLAVTAQRGAGDTALVVLEPVSIREGFEIELSACP